MIDKKTLNKALEEVSMRIDWPNVVCANDHPKDREVTCLGTREQYIMILLSYGLTKEEVREYMTYATKNHCLCDCQLVDKYKKGRFENAKKE